MAKFRFYRDITRTILCEVEAEDFEAAKELVENGNCTWEDDCGGEEYFSNSWAYSVDDNDDNDEELDWNP